MLAGRSQIGCIGIFGGSRSGTHPEYTKIASEFGSALARSGAGLVYNPKGSGLSRAVAHAAWVCGGRVVSVMPHSLCRSSGIDGACGEIFLVRSSHECKALTYRLASCFAVLPGGLDTIDDRRAS